MALPTDTIIGTSATVIGSPILIERQEPVAIVIENTGSVAFNSFIAQIQITPNGPMQNWLGGSDFNAAIPGQMSWVGATPVTLAANSYTRFTLIPGPCYAIQFLATVASGSTTANQAYNTESD